MLSKSMINWLIKLRENGRLTLASCPTRDAQAAESLIEKGRLRVFNDKKRLYVEIADVGLVDTWIGTHTKAAPEGTTTRAAAIFETNDSKGGKDLSFSLFMFRAADQRAWLSVNGHQHNVAVLNDAGGALTLLVNQSSPQALSGNLKLYLIENRESWANAERYLPSDGIYLHYEGWLSEKMLGWLSKAQFPKIVLSPDYDLVGLANWIRLSESISDTELFFPTDFVDQLKAHKNEKLWKKQQGYLLAVSELIERRNNPIEARWLTTMMEHGAVLEQEALLIEKAII